MKKRMDENIGLKILSLLIAMIFWLIIINLADPTATRTFRGIPVEIINQNAISAINQVFEVIDGETVDVTVKGKRSVVDDLKEQDFVATADLSHLSPVNAATINVKLNKYYTNQPDLDWGNKMLVIKLENLVKKQFNVNVIPKGQVAEGYFLGESVVKPNIIEVSGGVSKVAMINSIGVELDVMNLSNNFISKLKPIPFDVNGKKIEALNLSYNNNQLTVEAKILKTKAIPILLDITGTPAEGYQYVENKFKPETILIAGSDEELQKINEIKIPVDVTGAKGNIELQAAAEEYLPDGFQIADQNETISIQLVIKKLTTKKINLSESLVKIMNIPQNMDFSFAEPVTNLEASLSGLEDVLNIVNETNLNCYVDLKNLKEGKHTLTLQFDLPEGIKLENKPIKVKVRLKQTSAESNTTTPTPAPSGEGAPMSENMN